MKMLFSFITKYMISLIIQYYNHHNIEVTRMVKMYNFQIKQLSWGHYYVPTQCYGPIQTHIHKHKSSTKLMSQSLPQVHNKIQFE